MSWEEVATIILAEILHVAVWLLPALAGAVILDRLDAFGKWIGDVE